jgi:hypothetical protein
MRLDKFKGMNNRAHVANLPEGYLHDVTDMVIDNAGLAQLRPGYAFRLSGLISALFATADGSRCFAVKDNDLVELNDDFTIKATLKSGIGNYPVSFCECDGSVFYAGSAATGKITGANHSSFGIAKVMSYPTLALISGSLEQGRYLVAVTHLDVNGFESGVGYYGVIEVNAANKGIGLSDIPVSSNPRVTHTCIYISDVNGKELFRRAKISNGNTSYSATTLNYSSHSLRTKSLDAAPFAAILRYFYGRLFAASGQCVFYSEGKDYEHWDYRKYLYYAENVTALMPVEDGLWVCADGLYFISGRDPANFNQSKKSEFRLFQNSEQLIPSHRLKVGDYQGIAWIAACSKGLAVLGNGGFLYFATTDKYNMPMGVTGAVGAVFEWGDSFNYMAMLSPQDLTFWDAGDVIPPPVDPLPPTVNDEAGLVYGSVTAGESLAAYTIVVSAPGGCIKFDPTNFLHLNRVIGMTLQAYNLGDTAKIYFAGIVTNNAWNFSVAAGAVFGGAAGSLTQDLTGFVIQQRVAIAVAPTQLKLQFDDPQQIGQPV